MNTGYKYEAPISAEASDWEYRHEVHDEEPHPDCPYCQLEKEAKDIYVPKEMRNK